VLVLVLEVVWIAELEVVVVVEVEVFWLGLECGACKIKSKHKTFKNKKYLGSETDVIPTS